MTLIQEASMRIRLSILFLTFILSACGETGENPVTEESAAVYDIVIAGGRVIDPESGLDAIRNVGIADGRVTAFTTEDLHGTSVIDAAGS